VTKRTAKRRRRGLTRFLRGWWVLIAVLALLVYYRSIPPWVWTLTVGAVVVAVVYYWLGFLRGRRK
jgi:O-antigen/teichoic acid export membrane protein